MSTARASGRTFRHVASAMELARFMKMPCHYVCRSMAHVDDAIGSAIAWAAQNHNEVSVNRPSMKVTLAGGGSVTFRVLESDAGDASVYLGMPRDSVFLDHALALTQEQWDRLATIVAPRTI